MRVGSLLRRGTKNLGMVCGDKVLVINKILPQLCDAVDVSPLWTASGRQALVGVESQVAQSGIPDAWSEYCESLDGCHWLPPVSCPEKIICIGLNYRDHAAEANMPVPKEPIFFNKYNSALVGADGPVILPSNSSQVDYEAELAVVLGKAAKRVSESDALDYVGGYMAMNDVSARDWQFRTGQWVCGKTFDTFAPCGPYLVTPDEIEDPHNLSIRLSLNGEVMQSSNTRHLIFRVPFLISYISQLVTLRPGDIISTGTPPGVGFARKPQVFLRDSDVVEISIEKIGSMRHRVVAE